jgi:hypothetical protein
MQKKPMALRVTLPLRTKSAVRCTFPPCARRKSLQKLKFEADPAIKKGGAMTENNVRSAGQPQQITTSREPFPEAMA